MPPIAIVAYCFAAISYPQKVIVAGSSGRVGCRVVRTLLERTDTSVVALARSGASRTKLMDALSQYPAAEVAAKRRLEIVQCDLRDEGRLRTATRGAEAAIWCATGFSDGSSAWNKVKGLFNLYAGRTVDIDGLANLATCMKENREARGLSNDFMDVVMCSSAGVTRTQWSEEKKFAYPGAADIPIVRLNPFGILDQKRESENALRKTGCKYTILRPTGLNDNWPPGRPLISQGDMAVGRISRDDVAELLCALVAEPTAAGKTVEAMAIPGYPKLRSLSAVYSKCSTDEELADNGGTLSETELQRQYALLQQLLPGETGDAAALAMGQTYEQLDAGVQGRLGARGEERAPIVRE